MNKEEFILCCDKLNIKINEELYSEFFTYFEMLVEWNNKFKEKYGSAPNYTNAYAYDLGMILYHVALKIKQGKEKDVSQLLLETNFDGITGKLRFSPEGLLIGEYVTSIYKNSKFVPLN